MVNDDVDAKDYQDYQDYNDYSEYSKQSSASQPKIEPGNVTPFPDTNGSRRQSIINAGIESLPTVGAAVGGVAGAAEGGIGAYPGAMAGGTVGTGAKNIAEGLRDQGLSYLTNKPTSKGLLNATKDVAEGGAEGGLQELGGRAISKGLSVLKPAVKESAKYITDAAERLGIKATNGMLSDSPMGQGLESSLNQSPSGAGAVVRSDTRPIQAGLQKAAQDVLKDSSGKSSYQAGGDAAKGVISNIGEDYNNVQQAYEPFNKELPKMTPEEIDKWKLADQTAKATKGNLSLTFQGDKWGESLANKVMESKNLDDVENIRKQVSSALRTAYKSHPPDYNAIDAISKAEDHLNNFRDDQFQKLAMKNYPQSVYPGGKAIGSDMVDQYKNAQGQYAQLMNKLKPIGDALGIRANNPKSYIDAFDKMPEEKLASKLSSTKYVQAAEAIKENLPEQFEQIRKYQLSQIAEKSMTDGQIDPVKLVKNSNKLSPEFKEMIFGEKVSKLNDMETVINSLPKKMGPSGTPQGELYNQSWNPALQGKEALRYGVYKGLTSPTLSSVLSPKNTNAVGRGAGILGRGLLNGK